jgi:hypothetical protein
VVVASISIVVAVMVAVVVTVATVYLEIGSAAMVHPDATVIRTPTVAFAASRFAALLH